MRTQNNFRKVLANVFFISFSTFVASKSIAQPFLLECNLDTKFVRDNVVEKDYSRLCKSCKIEITVDEKSGILLIDGVGPQFGTLYDTKGKDVVDSIDHRINGTWSISSRAIVGSYVTNYGTKERGLGRTSVTINRLTGDFYGHHKSKNPIGEGDIVVTTNGQCRSAKPAF